MILTRFLYTAEKEFKKIPDQISIYLKSSMKFDLAYFHRNNKKIKGAEELYLGSKTRRAVKVERE